MFEIKTLKDGLKKIAPRTKTKAITDDANKSLDTILSEKANSTDVPSKVSQLTNDTGFITNAALANYPNNTQMNAAINAHHDSTKQDKLAAQTPYTGAGSKSKIPKITTNALGQVTNVEEVAIEAQSADLSQNLSYANDNNSEIVIGVSSDGITDDNTTTGLSMTFSKISDGSSVNVDFPIFKFLNVDFLVDNSGNVKLNPTKFANYLLKSDAPGYADILTKTLASSIYATESNVIVELAKKLDVANVVDNLTSTDTNKALSANQGKVLNDKITTETNRAKGAESTLTTDLSNEVTRAKAKENELNTKIDTKTLLLNGSQINFNPVDDLNNFKTGIGYFSDTVQNTPPVTLTQMADATFLVISAATNEGIEVTHVQIAINVVIGLILQRAFVGGSWSNWSIYHNIANNLTTDNQFNVLSAKQGKVLNETKQDKLVSGTSIKTINSESLLGSGNIELAAKTEIANKVDKQYLLANANLNDVLTSGFYRINEGCTNLPNDYYVTCSQLLVISGGGDTICQMIFIYNKPGHFWMRTGNNLGTDAVTFQPWVLYSNIQTSLSGTTLNITTV